jgi:hypothetical protein
MTKAKSQKAMEKELDKTPGCENDPDCDCETVAAPAAPKAKAQGLKAMSEKDVNEYMESLIQAQQPPAHLPEIELMALAQYRGAIQQSGNTERQLTRAQAQVENLKATLSRLQGSSEAFVNLLVLAEDSRRAAIKQ